MTGRNSEMTQTAQTRVLVVDDSVTIRRLLRLVLASDPTITVVGEAADAFEARELIKQTDPDVITLDVEMPKMDGIEFLKRLMRLRPMPVVMISTLTHKGSDCALKALSLGAVEVFGKPTGSEPEEWRKILPLVKAAARAQVTGPRVAAPTQAPQNHGPWSGRILAIGASTGGVDALETLMSRFPEDCPPTMIVQHMPELFLASLASRLDQKYAPRVMLGTQGVTLRQGQVYLAAGGESHMVLAPDGNSLAVQVGERISGHRPSVDALFSSAVPHGAKIVASLLTGMGRDGAEGLLKLRDAGAHTIAQNEATSVVYGMPRAAVEMNAATEVLPLTSIADAMLAHAAKPLAPRARKTALSQAVGRE